ALVDGLKRIWISPTESASIKLTKLQAGGESSNIIPGNATIRRDARAQKNETMETLTAAFEKVVRAVSTMYDVTIDYTMEAHIVAAQVGDTSKNIMAQPSTDVCGNEKRAEAIVTPGGEDLHFYTYCKRELQPTLLAFGCRSSPGVHLHFYTYSKPELRATMLGLGSGVTPGLHHPEMTFNQSRLPTGVEIVTRAIILALKRLESGE